jgi:tetratricopeptide (TPR) repeat protein
VILAVGILAAGLSLAGNPATAPKPGTRTIQATAGQMLNLAEEMVRRGDKQGAEALLDLLARDPDANVRNEARFRRALMLEASGRNEGAAVLLRRILDEKPDASAVRLKLATTLQKLGHEDSALRELRALRSSDLPPDVARFVDRLSASLQATKPLGFQVELALAPDTNINRATRSDTLGTIFGDFTLDKGSQARSGVGAAVRGLAQARQMLRPNLGIVARASGEANLYRHKAFDDIALELSIGPEWRLGRTRLSAEAGIGRQWYGMKPFQRSLRFSASAARPIDSVSQLRLDGSVRWIDNRLNNLQDGHGLSLRARYERALSVDLLVAANVGFDRYKARDAAYSTRGWNAGISAYRSIGRMTLSAGVDLGRLHADDRLLLLPKARADRLTRFSVGSVFRQFTFAGFAPVTRLIIERNRSTVEFYDFRRVRTEFGISRAF